MYFSILGLAFPQEKFLNIDLLDQREFTFKITTDTGKLSFQEDESIYIPTKCMQRNISSNTDN